MNLATKAKITVLFIEKLGLLIYTALAVGSLWYVSLSITLGVIVGGAFALLNFRLLWAIVVRAFLDPENPRPLTLFLLVPKFLGIALVVFLVAKCDWLNIVAFFVGTLCLFGAIVLVGAGIRPRDDGLDEEEATGDTESGIK
jgi:ATP synthase I chain